MMVQSKYFAREDKYSNDPKKKATTYFFYAGQEEFSERAETSGLFSKINTLDDDTIFRFMRSTDKNSQLKSNDYNIINNSMITLVDQVKKYCTKNNTDFHINKNSNVDGDEGCRKLKEFEEKLLLKALGIKIF